MPTRNRAEMWRKSAESLGKRAEILVWIDEDEPQMEAYLNHGLGEHVKIYIKPRVGYLNFHIMVNFLCEQASGDWFLLWNDDAVMETDDWCEKIERIDSKIPRVINFYAPENFNHNLFPIISRSMYKAMGHYSQANHCDSWVQDIANKLRIHVPLFGIKARHIRDEIEDDTKGQTQSVYSVSSPAYHNEEMKTKRDLDALKIYKHIFGDKCT